MEAEPLAASPAKIKVPFPLTALQSLSLVLFSLLLGILADGLFRATLPGINVTLFQLVLVTGLYGLGRFGRLEPKPNPILLAAMALLALLFFWRASPFLQFLNLAVSSFLFLLVVGQLSYQSLWRSHFGELLINGLRLIFGPFFSFFTLVFGSPWKDLGQHVQGRNSRWLLSAFRGLVFAIPLFIMFAVLLASADALFEQLLQRTFRFDFESWLEHSLIILFIAMVALAFLAQTFLDNPWQHFELKTPKLLQFGRIETALVFGSLSLLFASFILVQASYLFGGESRVLGSSLSYAQYGRRGFFELVTVTVLLHIVLLVGMWFCTQPKAKQLYKILATILVFLLYGVIISAFSRLNLYITTYGLTELRFYSSAMIIWIAVVMLYFLFQLFSSKAPKLLPSYIILGVLGVTGLYLSNPDAAIARTNLSRISVESEFDAEYLGELSLDIVKPIQDYLEQNPESPVRYKLHEVLRDKTFKLPEADWRSFNVGRWHGEKQLLRQ
ncbi:MAG: DUF4173 domain-containing protein [Trueperaceae bacterium]|nr:DUF4173 domain-containing protein [Trueperaceae bacterium]